MRAVAEPAVNAELSRSAVVLNDIQSQLNATGVLGVVAPESTEDVQRAIHSAGLHDQRISVAGGRHSMGRQQFATDSVHLDTRRMSRILHLDATRGLATVEAGIMWPELIEGLEALQPGASQPWTIRQKQTGVDDVTLAGSISANAHGRVLTRPPLVDDVEAFDLVDAATELRHCSRTENPELFALAIGGYGLFGVITQVTLRLIRRFKVRRHVEVIPVSKLLDRLQVRLAQGCLFGDCQYATHLTGDPEVHPGVFPCYEPVDDAVPVTPNPVHFAPEDWARLYQLIRTDKPRAFQEYASHYCRTDGQVYLSDRHQLARNFVGHRQAVRPEVGTEMISEVYIRPENLMPFFGEVREDLRAFDADISYGTIRFIRADRETFLAWAKEDAVCVVCNLHVRHTPAEIEKARATVRRILDRVVKFGGSFYLTYHGWATPEHLQRCYPRIGEFFRLKRHYDPHELFQSDWYRQYVGPLGG